jgi:hypothetical protein
MGFIVVVSSSLFLGVLASVLSGGEGLPRSSPVVFSPDFGDSVFGKYRGYSVGLYGLHLQPAVTVVSEAYLIVDAECFRQLGSRLLHVALAQLHEAPVKTLFVFVMGIFCYFYRFAVVHFSVIFVLYLLRYCKLAQYFVYNE